MVIVLCYLSYGGIQLTKTAWAMTKFDVMKDMWNPEILGVMDLLFMGGYAVGMFIAGSIGDKMNTRIFFSFGLVGTGSCYLIMWIMFVLDIENPYPYHFLWLVNGLL